MADGIFEHLLHDWHRGASHLHHHGVTIATTPSQPVTEGTPMNLQDLINEGRTLLEDGESKVRTFLDDHMTQIASVATLFAENPIFGIIQKALDIPELAPILNGIAETIDKLAAAYPKPGEAAPAVPTAPEPPAEATPEPAPQPA